MSLNIRPNDLYVRIYQFSFQFRVVAVSITSLEPKNLPKCVLRKRVFSTNKSVRDLQLATHRTTTENGWYPFYFLHISNWSPSTATCNQSDDAGKTCRVNLERRPIETSADGREEWLLMVSSYSGCTRHMEKVNDLSNWHTASHLQSTGDVCFYTLLSVSDFIAHH